MLACGLAVGFGYAKTRLGGGLSAIDETKAPALETSWTYRGGSDRTTRVGVYPIGRRVRWRVHSPGSSRCTGRGHSVLWNRVYGEITADPRMRFAQAGEYRDKEKLEGTEYDQLTKWQIRGRVTPSRSWGTFRRVDGFYRDRRLVFSCERGGRWNSPRGG